MITVQDYKFITLLPVSISILFDQLENFTIKMIFLNVGVHVWNGSFKTRFIISEAAVNFLKYHLTSTVVGKILSSVAKQIESVNLVKRVRSYLRISPSCRCRIEATRSKSR